MIQDGHLMRTPILQHLLFNEGILIMRKRILIFVILTNALLLSSCAVSGSSSKAQYRQGNARVAYELTEQITIAINNKDRATIKSMFSKQALIEAKDFDASMDYLFELFQGEIKSISDNGLVVSTSNNYGHKTEDIEASYVVETDKNKYIFFLVECTINTDIPDKLGLYTLRVIKAEDRATQYGTWQNMAIPGIYKPST